MVGLCLAKSIYAIPSWTKAVALVAERRQLERCIESWSKS
jgi:hypothetical protein